MTSAPKLTVVGLDTAAPGWRAETTLRQWDPEAQLVGALLHLPAARVAPILALVPDAAIWHPDHRWAYEIVRHLVDAGADPDPVVVLRTARHRPPSDGGHSDSARRHHAFAVRLADLYTNTVSPGLVGQYAGEVLEDAYRRAVRFHGIRMTQLSETDCSREELTECLTAMRAELAELWRRAEAAKPRRRNLP
jgi:LmbE family N-acetylglucosaminyl deacetylase